LNAQHKAAFNKLLNAYKLFRTNTKALDVGCGFGRWCAEYEKKGFAAYGIDIGGTCYIQASAKDIPFKDKTFDVVSTVTVLQHINRESQELSLDEIERVTAKGGALLLMEHMCDVSGKIWEGVFPRTESEWISALEKRGYVAVEKIYFQHTPVMTSAISFFNRMEKFRRSLRKSEQFKNVTECKQTGLANNPRTSLRLKLYRTIKAFTLSVTAASDYLITCREQFRKGSHLGILAVKIENNTNRS
jgi:ubiquinone/menaquinone biosynthesis C-methylase UbiE